MLARPWLWHEHSWDPGLNARHDLNLVLRPRVATDDFSPKDIGSSRGLVDEATLDSHPRSGAPARQIKLGEQPLTPRIDRYLADIELGGHLLAALSSAQALEKEQVAV